MELNVLIKDLKKRVESIASDFSLLQVGSSVVKKDYNDLDFLIISHDKKKTISDLLDLFEDFDVKKIDDAIRVKNYLDKEISFAVYQTDYFNNLIYDYLIGSHVVCEHKTWTVGYWLIEGFVYDISKSNIIIDNHNLKGLKQTLEKDHIYAKKQLLLECLEEIKIKSNYLTKNIMQDDFLKMDILLASLRAFSIISKIPLRGFKNIKDIIQKLPQQYKKYLYNLLNDDYSCVDAITNEISDYIINNSNYLYMGTWQFNGSFKQLSDTEIIDLLKYAKKIGINHFDTALVYGKAEELLGKCLSESDIVLTKVPAKIKPNLNDDRDIDLFYDYKYIKDCINKSSSNLNRNVIDIILLHNWSSKWDNNEQMISLLRKLKEKKLAKKIGISLPNNFNNTLSKNILELIDVIEAPYNEENIWIEKDIVLYKSYNIEIILRSLFLQGKILKTDLKKYNEIFEKALSFDTSIVVGMTTENQINQNLDFTWRKKYERL